MIRLIRAAQPRRCLVATLACTGLLGASVIAAGCGDKKQAAAPVAPGAAPAASAGASQGKISTGADPAKAPSYPNMYGKPAGSK